MADTRAAVIACVPPANRRVAPLADENVPPLDPPALKESVPLLTATVPELLNGTLNEQNPAPTVREKVPLLKNAFAPPKFSNVLSAWALKKLLLVNVPFVTFSRPPLQVATPLLITLRLSPLSETPEMLSVDVPPNVVAPAPLIAPAVQSPEVLIVSRFGPSMFPPPKARPSIVTPAGMSCATFPPLMITL
ncbi:MAG TPA: hypothetical protein VH518_18420 [Tepidisphaeraceae bacterium]